MKGSFLTLAAFALLANSLAFSQQAEREMPIDIAAHALEVAVQEAKLRRDSEKATNTLFETLATLQAEVTKAKKQFGPNHPKMEGLKDAINEAKAMVSERTPRFRAYRLKYIKPDLALQLTRRVLSSSPRNRMAVDDRTNSLIVSASPLVHDELQSIIQAIDVSSTDELLTVQFNLQNEDAVEQAVEALEPTDLVAQWSARHSRQGSQLTVTAESKEKLAQVQKIIDVLSARPGPKARLVRIVWLVSDLSDPRPLPEDMKPVIAELEKQGVKNMAVAAQTSVRTLHDFELACVATIEPGTSSAKLSLSGTVGGDGVRLSLKAHHGDVEVAKIRTTIGAPSGHPVVLGVSPIHSNDSAFVVIVSEGG